MIHKLLLALLVSFCVLSTGLGQDPKPQAPPPVQSPTPSQIPTPDDKEDVVRITTNLVQVDVGVTKGGKPVKDLKAEDFEIFEDGRRQTITSFTYVSNVSEATSPAKAVGAVKDKNAPPVPANPLQPNVPHRTIAFVVDDLGLSVESMIQVKKQLRKFLMEEIQPNDLIAIIRTGGEMGALQQFTNDSRVIERALGQVKWNICSRVGIHVLPPILPGPLRVNPSPFGPCGGSSTYGNTVRALRFIVEAMGELPGRKSMVVFSDSLPVEEQEINPVAFSDDQSANQNTGFQDTFRSYLFLLQRIAEKAIRSSVVIYAVDTQGLQPTGITAADSISGPARGMNAQINSILSSRSNLLIQRREGAELIARQTGGFLVRNSNYFELPRIVEDQSGYYLIGYRPSDETFNKRFHRIKARVKRSGMEVRTRFGFYGISEDEANRAKRTPADKAAVALMSPFGAQDIDLGLTAFFADEKDTGSLVRSFIYLDVKDLTFTEAADGWHNASIELRGMIFGDNGIVVNEVTHSRTLSLRGQTYEQALREGLSVQFDIPTRKAGSYQVRVAARDLTSSRIGAAGQFVTVPDLNNKRLALSGIVMRAALESTGLTSGQGNGASPAVRRFSPGSNLRFACAIYNAQIDAVKQQPNLVMQARLFRDAKVIYTSPEMVVDGAHQEDLSRVVATGIVRLSQDLETGTYFLQLAVVDTLLKEKPAQALQWIGFEIVK
jgi:VWFA-related protein